MSRATTNEEDKMPDFDGVQVFSSTMHKERADLGEKITEWRSKNPKLEIVDKIVTQSSDSSYHCLSITIFYKKK